MSFLDVILHRQHCYSGLCYYIAFLHLFSIQDNQKCRFSPFPCARCLLSPMIFILLFFFPYVCACVRLHVWQKCRFSSFPCSYAFHDYLFFPVAFKLYYLLVLLLELGITSQKNYQLMSADLIRLVRLEKLLPQSCILLLGFQELSNTWQEWEIQRW